MDDKKWEILHRTSNTGHDTQTIVEILLKNRGIKTKRQKEEFFNPASPEKISVTSLSLKTKEINKAINRIKKAKTAGEKVIIYGDYDADGICATAILWECLYSLKLDVLPYIPERFTEGYGLNVDSIKKLKRRYPDLGLIITVDNGVVAYEAVNAASDLGIDVIITDHHQKGRKLPKAHALVHTTEIGGAGIAWFFARELLNKLEIGNRKSLRIRKGLGLCAIGTIADQIPLLGANRSLTKYGLKMLNSTKRVGLLALISSAGIKKGSIGNYEIGFVIAPRINAMGRMAHAIDSLRLLCTKDSVKAKKLADLLGKTNYERQKTVKKVVTHARFHANKADLKSVIVLSHKSYHEGVIGLAASKLVEEHYRPTIILSEGKDLSKASARSIPGFDIIKALRSLDDYLIESGGHPMAAGFSIKTEKIGVFRDRLEKLSNKMLTKDKFTKKLIIDAELPFNLISDNFLKAIKKFDPTGSGNPEPVFVAYGVDIIDARTVGADGRHLKLIVEKKDCIFNAIGFGFGEYIKKLIPLKKVDLAFSVEENVWNGRRSLQLRIKDLQNEKD